MINVNNFFKKKEVKYKQTTESDPWIVKAWNTSRGRAGIKLALYGIFVVTVFLLIIFKGEPTPNVYKSRYSLPTVSYQEKLNAITANNYEYIYTINKPDFSVEYRGKKHLNLDIGYRYVNDEILKYLIENGDTYKLGLENTKEIIDNLYESINKDYLNIHYIYGMINNIEPIVEKNTYTYKIDDIKSVVIEVKESSVSKIKITDDLDVYELEFKNVGHVSDITLDD